MAMHPMRAAGNLIVSGSSRYSSAGSRKKAPRLKTFAVTHGGAMGGGIVGSSVGGLVGGMAAGLGSRRSDHMGRNAQGGAAVGATVGGYLGMHAGHSAGKRASVNAGYTRRTKQRMSLRVTNASFGHADKHFHGSVAHHRGM